MSFLSVLIHDRYTCIAHAILTGRFDACSFEVTSFVQAMLPHSKSMVAIIVTTQREIIKEEAFVRFLLRLCSLPQSIVPTVLGLDSFASVTPVLPQNAQCMQ